MSLATRFLPAFLATLENFAERDYFAQAAPDRCPDGHVYFWDETAIRKTLVMQLGVAAWPLADADAAAMSDEQVIEYMEAFFQLVAKPTESWFHSYCGSSHPTKFDIASGRYDYTVSVNALLDRFGTGLRLQNGKIRSSGSQVMAPRLAEALPFGGDDHLRGLVTMALVDFRSPDPQKRWNALRHGGRGADPPNPALKVPAVRVLAVVWVCHGPRTGRLLLAFRGFGHVRPLGPLG